MFQRGELNRAMESRKCQKKIKKKSKKKRFWCDKSAILITYDIVAKILNFCTSMITAYVITDRAYLRVEPHRQRRCLC